MKDWASTFARFRPGRIPLIGPIAVLVSDWSKPQPGRAPMFDQALIDRFSIAHPAPPFVVYAPAGLWLLWRGWTAGLTIASLAAAYLAGLLVWSLLEYVTHRGSFHHAPASTPQVAIAYLVHGMHHAYPEDSRRWVFPISISLPLAAVFYLLFTATLGRVGLPVFAGFIHGYLTYDLLHYFIHRGRMPTAVGRFLRQHHLSHHYKTPDRKFGVSSPLWDVIFRTK